MEIIGNWISASKRLPADHEEVLALVKYGRGKFDYRYQLAKFAFDGSTVDGILPLRGKAIFYYFSEDSRSNEVIPNVKYWQHLPPLPSVTPISNNNQ